MMPSTDHNHHIQAKAMSNEMINNQQSSASRKTGSSLRPPEQALKCPRCDSPNTKFCYYNNYSLTQPRHFCKSCRRYWTKGGALRNVPIGGGCRKNKKIRSSSGSRLSGDSRDSPASSENGGLNFFHAPSSMELQLLGSAGVGGGGISFTRNGIFSNFVSYGDISSSSTCVPTPSAVINPTTNPSCFDVEGPSTTTNTAGSLMGFNFTTGSSSASGFNSRRLSSVHQQDMGSSVSIQSHNNSLASSIESLSCLNQDLHWKLQQQRLGMLFGNEEMNQCSKERDFGSNGGDNLLHGVHHDQVEKPQPILFHNLEIPKEEAACDLRKSSGFGGNNTTTEWFFENRSTTFPNSKNSSEQGILQGNEDTSTWNGIHQDWNHHHQQQQQLHDHQHQYSTALPE